MSPNTPELAPEEVAALRAEHDLAFFEAPSEAAPAEAEREANRLLAALKSTRAEMAANQRVHDDEVSRTKHWLDRVNRTPLRKETWLLNMLEAVAPFLPRFGKKSRDLPHGVVGWRKKPERIVIEDPAAVLAWAKVAGLETKTEEVVPHAVVERAWKEGLRRAHEGQEPEDFVPPGCKVVPAEDEFYAKPSDVA